MVWCWQSLAWPGYQQEHFNIQNRFIIKIIYSTIVKPAIYSLFEIVALLLQSGLVFANCQQLRLSLLKAARQLINDLQHARNIFCYTEIPKNIALTQKESSVEMFKYIV